MDQVDLSHGLAAAVNSLTGVAFAAVAVFAITKLCEAYWAYRQKNKSPTGEEFRMLSKRLELTNDALTETRKDLAEQAADRRKYSHDIHRIYLFLKAIAGEQWPNHFRKVVEIEKEEKLTKGDL